MTLLEQLRKPEEVKRWFDQIGDQAANEIESLQQQLTAARRSKNECVIDLYRSLDMLDDLNLNLQQKITELKTFIGLDCGDQSCRFAVSHTGMRTNGGCRCNPQIIRIRTQDGE